MFNISDRVHIDISLNSIDTETVVLGVILCLYIDIKYVWFVNTFCRYTHLNDQTVLVLTIQFIVSQQS